MAAEARSSRSARGKSSAADVAGREPMFSESPEDGPLTTVLNPGAGCNSLDQHYQAGRPATS